MITLESGCIQTFPGFYYKGGEVSFLYDIHGLSFVDYLVQADGALNLDHMPGYISYHNKRA